MALCKHTYFDSDGSSFWPEMWWKVCTKANFFNWKQTSDFKFWVVSIGSFLSLFVLETKRFLSAHNHLSEWTILVSIGTFWLTMTLLTESFNSRKHTPLYKNKQNERETLQWRLLYVLFYHLPCSYVGALSFWPQLGLLRWEKLNAYFYIFLWALLAGRWLRT